jgi:hypothetical protein
MDGVDRCLHVFHGALLLSQSGNRSANHLKRQLRQSQVPCQLVQHPLTVVAGVVIIAMVVLAVLYMRNGMANRHKKSTVQTETSKIGVGPATNVQKGLLSDQARSGLDTGQTHVPGSLTPRPSILGADGSNAADSLTGRPIGSSSATSIPPIEYRSNPVSTAADGSLSFAEQRRVDEYKREVEAMEAPTSVKGNLPSEVSTPSSAQHLEDPLQAIQAALLNARATQGLGGNMPTAAVPTGVSGWGRIPPPGGSHRLRRLADQPRTGTSTSYICPHNRHRLRVHRRRALDRVRP